MFKISFKEYLKRQVFTLCVHLLFLVLLYTFFRAVFYWANSGNFSDTPLITFLYGIRFDLSAISFTNALYIIALLIPFPFYIKKIYRFFCNLYFILVNSFAALVSFTDVAYYPYVLKRMTFDFFTYLQIGFDFQTLLPSFLKQFWYLVLLFAATVTALVFVVKFTNRKLSNINTSGKFSKISFLYKTLVFVVFMGISFLGIRGGTQLRPISLIDTAKSVSIQNAALVSNTPFSLIQSYGKKFDIEENYFESLEEAELYFSPLIDYIKPCYENCYPVKNVLVIVLESFSQYLINGTENDQNSDSYQGFCPFLHELQQRSISFNGISNAHRTIEALPAIFGGFPSLLNMCYMQSPFASNYTYSPVQILKDKGYKTLFFHGAKNGSMQIESYCYAVGFEKYYGKNEYHYSPDDDSVWGISDRPFLTYVSQVLSAVPQPFFATVLTLTSHNPFILPKDAKDLDINKGTHPMHAVASYTDFAIRDFFEKISQYPWYDSTLFVFTADHTGEGSLPKQTNSYTRHQIPLFFFHPLAKTNKTDGIMQQMDIMPSIFSYLKINTPLFSYGNNRFDPDYIPYAINRSSGDYQLISDDFLLRFDGEKATGFFDIKSDLFLKDNLLISLSNEVLLYEQKVKAILQSYTTRMATNRLFSSSEFESFEP